MDLAGHSLELVARHSLELVARPQLLARRSLQPAQLMVHFHYQKVPLLPA
jgi:hypothetical protein